jgi:xanthine dehydrogenase accessory factor
MTQGRFALDERAASLRAARVPFVLATVVRAERPTSATVGDTALVLGDGTIEGFVGGTCAESSVRLVALDLLGGGAARLRIHPDAGPDRVVAADGAIEVHNPCLSGGTLEVLLEAITPPPLLVVHGTAPIARALAAVAAPAGFAVVAVAGAPSVPVAEDAAAVVVASHGREEEAALVGAVRAGVPYVGLVASRRRAAAVLAGLALTDDERARIHSPAGLDIGARTPEEIAVSILAEIVRERPPSATARAAEPVAPPREPVAPPREPVAAVDPVCGMTVAAVPSSLHVDVGRGRVWFCGSGCRDAYLADPAAYGAGGAATQ